MACSKSCVIIYLGMLLLTAGFVSSLGAWFAPPFNTFVRTVRIVGPILMLFGAGLLVLACLICACEQGKCPACYQPGKSSGKRQRGQDIANSEHDMVRSFISQESLDFDNVSPDCAECQHFIRSHGYEEAYMAYLQRHRESIEDVSIEEPAQKENYKWRDVESRNEDKVQQSRPTPTSGVMHESPSTSSESPREIDTPNKSNPSNTDSPEEVKIEETNKETNNAITEEAIVSRGTKSTQTCIPPTSRQLSLVNTSDLKGVSPVMVRHMIRNNSSRFQFAPGTLDQYLQANHSKGKSNDDCQDNKEETTSIPKDPLGQVEATYSEIKHKPRRTSSQVCQRPKSLPLARASTSPDFNSDEPYDKVTVYIPLDSNDNFAPKYKATDLDLASSAFTHGQLSVESQSDQPVDSQSQNSSGLVGSSVTDDRPLDSPRESSRGSSLYDKYYAVNNNIDTYATPITVSKRQALIPGTGHKTVYDVSF